MVSERQGVQPTRALAAEEARAEAWCRANAVTDEEAADVAGLLCDHEPRDLALMAARMQARGG